MVAGSESLSGISYDMGYVTQNPMFNKHKVGNFSAFVLFKSTGNLQRSVALRCLWTTGCTKSDLSALAHWMKTGRTLTRTQTHAWLHRFLLSLNKYRGPSIRKDKDAIGNFHCSVVTKQLLDEWLRKGREELTHSTCDVKDDKGHTNTHTQHSMVSHTKRTHTCVCSRPWRLESALFQGN